MAVTSARPRKRKRRLVYVVAGLACVVAIGLLLFGGLRSNIVYFRTVSEAVEENDDGRFRLAGEVVAGTIIETDDGVQFDVTDGEATVTVVNRGDPPGLFGDEVPIVAEGHWGEGTTFESDRILVRHDNQYQPPDVTTAEPGS